MTQTIKIFNYNEELDFFTVTPEFSRVSGLLGLQEWTPVVWLGRLFCMDNDFGEQYLITGKSEKK